MSPLRLTSLKWPSTSFHPFKVFPLHSISNFSSHSIHPLSLHSVSISWFNPTYYFTTLRFLSWLRETSPLLQRHRRVVASNPASIPTPTTTTTTTTSLSLLSNSSTTLSSSHPSFSLLTRDHLAVVRQLEMLNVLIGYEQANKYAIQDQLGSVLGYIIEEDSFGKSIFRNLLKTHRPMKALILNPQGQVLFKIHRPFTWINSRIYIHTEKDEPIGHVEQEWHLFRRKYHLFNSKEQFAYINAPWLSWSFTLENEQNQPMALIDRNFAGFARELFTDTGHYAVHLNPSMFTSSTSPTLTPTLTTSSFPSKDQSSLKSSPLVLSLDERAVTMACAITIDVDYFSRERGGGMFGFFGGFTPFGIFGGGGGIFGGGGDNGEEWNQDPILNGASVHELQENEFLNDEQEENVDDNSWD